VTKILGSDSKYFKLIKDKDSLLFSPTLKDPDLRGPSSRCCTCTTRHIHHLTFFLIAIIMWFQERFDNLINIKKTDGAFMEHTNEWATPLSSGDMCGGLWQIKISLMFSDLKLQDLPFWVMWVVEFLTAGFLLSFSLFSLSSLGFIIALATFYNSPSICFSLGFDYYSFNYYIFFI